MFDLLKQNDSYRKLFFSGLINGVGDRFSQVAMLTMLLTLTGSGFSVGMVMIMEHNSFTATSARVQGFQNKF